MVKDSRNRHCLNGKGDRLELRIRLKCRSCGKIHTELPDFLQPFKHYVSQVIEDVLDKVTTSCPAEGSTIKRWKQWFNKSTEKIDGILMAIRLFFTRAAIPLMDPTSLTEYSTKIPKTATQRKIRNTAKKSSYSFE